MVRGDVRDDGYVGLEVIYVVELETAQLQHVIVVLFGGHLVGVALAYVASESDVEAGILHQVIYERGRGRLAVAARDAYLLRIVVAAGKFYFGYDMYAAILAFAYHRRVARDAGTLDDLVCIEYQLLAVAPAFEGYVPILENLHVFVGNIPHIREEYVETFHFGEHCGTDAAFSASKYYNP